MFNEKSKIMKNGWKKVGPIYKEFIENFKIDATKGSLHDLLWQIFVNDYKPDTEVTFAVNLEIEGNQLVIALVSGGYMKTGIFFISEDYTECCVIASLLNKRVYKQNDDVHSIIVSKSMNNY